MNIELHLIQNFAPSCLNRDDTNTPKSCIFGGYRRARVSSQCLKRAMRLYMRDALDVPTGVRTRLLARKVAELLAERYDQDRGQAEELARLALRSAGFGLASEAPERTNVGLYLSSDEISLLADAVQADWDELARQQGAAGDASAEENSGAGGRRARAARRGGAGEAAPNVRRAVDAIGGTVAAADIALFGRMVAENTHMEVDAACQVAHALSTHEVETEMDFFTAVDDLQPEAEPGAGMMGIVEYNSACFYRYALIHRPQLIHNLRGDAALADRGIVAFVRRRCTPCPPDGKTPARRTTRRTTSRSGSAGNCRARWPTPSSGLCGRTARPNRWCANPSTSWRATRASWSECTGRIRKPARAGARPWPSTATAMSPR